MQEKALKQIIGLGGETYEERCTAAGIDTLERRRSLQDMAQTARATAGHLNLLKKHARTGLRRNSFAYRVVNQWNQLLDELKETKKIENFKKNLRKMGGRQVGGQ